MRGQREEREREGDKDELGEREREIKGGEGGGEGSCVRTRFRNRDGGENTVDCVLLSVNVDGRPRGTMGSDK